MFTIIIYQKNIINTVLRRLADIGGFLVIMTYVNNIKAQQEAGN